MRRSVATVAALGAFVASTGAYGFNESTGAIDGCASADGRPIAAKVETLYHVMLRSGKDIDAREDEDVVVRKTEGEGWIGYKCTNPKLPGIEIVKRYSKALGGVRRTLAFRNLNAETCYVTPFVECHFDAGFQDGAWFLGAGYIGPYKPFPKVAAPRIVNEHVQSSKGLAFVHPKSDRGGFAHYRTKIDDTVVFPWWHSTIGRYRELHDRLWYLPDGYRMGLGTFGLYEGKSVSVTDQFSAFDGDMFTFFDEIFAKDPDFSGELASIPAPSAWLDDCFATVDLANADKLRWMCDMTDDCEVFGWLGCEPSNCFSWGDYRIDRDFPTSGGGRCSGVEFKAGIDELKRRAPGAHLGTYSIVIATAWFTDVLKEHPTWFRRTDRSGSPDSLFPRMQANWQTMFCYPECRDWLVDMLVKWTDDIGTDVLYLDENQMTNTIDWERDRVTRDDDTAKFWQALSKRLKEKGKTYFANGSGVPYPDVNFMESPDELQPRLWRDWVGVGWGIGMMCRLRPGQRAMPLYWDGEGKCDYANRILALGWLPHTYLLHQNDFAVMRAAYQSGNMLPANVKYSPDWRTDETIDVEGHAVRREKARDVVLSFINRAAEAKDVPVGIDLGTLGFAADERISIWRQHLDFNRAGTRRDAFPSDAEARTNWREKGIVQGTRLTDPELVYSGKASGAFECVLRQLEPNRMDQFVVTAAPLSFFAVDDKPLNGFYTTQKRGRIDGHKVSLERCADVLFAGRGSVFSSVTANGRPVQGRFVNLKDGVGTLVTLEPGEWTLDWTESPVDAQNPPKAELPVVPTEPFRSSVRLPNGGYSDRVEELKDVGLEQDGATIVRSGLYVKSNSTGLVFQADIPFCAAAVDADKRTITAGLTRRETDVWSFDNFAGFELSGARSFRARFTHTFATAISSDFAHVLSDEGQYQFCGFTVDYRAGGEYVKRIAVSTGVFSRENGIENPPWGTKRKPDELYYAGEWIEEESGRVFSFDLAKFAPEGWDGVAFVSVGTSRIKPGRSISLEFLSFNDSTAKDFWTPVAKDDIRKCPPALRSRRLRAKPKSLGGIDSKEWRSWTLAAPFVRNRSGAVLAQSRAYFAHDNEYVYVGFEADEPTRRPICGNDNPSSHEHIELVLKGPEGTLHQIVADPLGRVLYYPDRHGTPVPKGFVVKGEVVPDVGWRVFFALPLSDLGLGAQVSPLVLSAEVCRSRRLPEEDSAWTPIDDFFDYSGYGTVTLDFEWPRTNYINNAVSDWTRADSYSDTSFVPGANDVVVIPADTTVTLDASKDAASLALVNSLERIVTATPTSRIEINVDEGDEKEITKSISGYRYSDAGSSGVDYVRGPIVKTGGGRLILSSADYFDGFLEWHYVVYDYYTQIIVSAGTLQLLPLYQHWMDHNTVALGRLTVEEGAVLQLPYGRADYAGTVNIMSLSGAGTVVNPVAWPTVHFLGSRANGDAATFSGKLNGSFYLQLNQGASYDAQALTGVSELSTQVAVGKGQRTGIGSFGNDGSPSPLGMSSFVGFEKDSGILEYVGEGETSSRPFLFSATDATASCRPTVIDAGARGGVTFTGQWQRHYQGNSGLNLVLTGSNTAECVLANNLNDNANTDDATGRGHTLYLRKEGSGVWRMKDTGANRQNFTSGISVDEGTLRYESIDQVGEVCSLGLATHLTDGTVGTDDASAHGVDYAIRLGAETYLGQKKTETACLEYVGSGNDVSTDRKIALEGTGCLKSSGTGSLTVGPVFGLGSGERKLILDGANTGANAVIGVTDGTDGAVVSLVKRGAGTWYLGGEQSFSGELAVEGGTLIARKSPHYTWYRWSLTKIKTEWLYIREFGLFDKDGNRQNRDLDFVASPIRSRTCNGQYFQLDRGTCAYGDKKGYRGSNDIRYLFDGKDTDANFTADIFPDAATSTSWITMDMRLAAGSNPITAYDVMWDGTMRGENFQLEGSLDGFVWDRLSALNEPAEQWDNNKWIADKVSGYDDPHKVANADFQIASAPAIRPNVLDSVTKVTVKGGGRLTVEDGVLSVDNLTVGKDGGTLDGVSFSKIGTLALEDVPDSPEIRSFEVPLTFLHAEGVENLPSWTVTVNGKMLVTKRVVLSDGKLRVVSNNGLIIILG